MKKTCFLPKRMGLIVTGLLIMAGRVQAQETAYSNPAGLPASGLQNSGSQPIALGLEFTVNSTVVVTALGAFDATIGGSGSGFGSPVQVGIYSEASQTFVSPTVTFSGTVGTAVDSYRFQPISSLTLNPGTYMVVAAGYGLATAPDWNTYGTGLTSSPIQFNTGGGALSAGRSLYNASDPGGQLEPVATVDSGPNPQYGAGSFQYTTSTGSGATRTVNTLADDGSTNCLRTLITASAAGDTINFSVSGTITLAGHELQIARNLNITGPGAAILAISANKASRVFNIISDTATVTISGLTISEGLNQGDDGTEGNTNGADGQGGGIFNSGNLTLANCTMTRNQALGGEGFTGGGDGGEGDDGGVFSEGPITVNNCAFSFNSANGNNGTSFGGNANGGAIYLTGGSLVNCTVANNSVTGGEGTGGGGALVLCNRDVFTMPSSIELAQVARDRLGHCKPETVTLHYISAHK
jgi:hypothetical protein